MPVCAWVRVRVCVGVLAGTSSTWNTALLSQVQLVSSREHQEANENLTPLPRRQRRSRQITERRSARTGCCRWLRWTLEHNPSEEWAMKPESSAPFTTISTEPLTWAISCILLFSTDQHYTPHVELGHIMALFTQSCLSCLLSAFLPGALYPKYYLSQLIKVHSSYSCRLYELCLSEANTCKVSQSIHTTCAVYYLSNVTLLDCLLVKN